MPLFCGALTFFILKPNKSAVSFWGADLIATTFILFNFEAAHYTNYTIGLKEKLNKFCIWMVLKEN